jgi:AcrR family transcriptional regulator
MAEGRRNRGPSAAADNRRALIAAAREVFSEQGLSAPLSAVARRAGVGQGSLYRHFPDRLSLALAAFEDNVVELEELASRPGTTLDTMLERITEQMIESVAFLDLLTSEHDDERMTTLVTRLDRTLARSLRQARADGRVRRSLRGTELALCLGMLAGVLTRAPAELREERARASWRLLDRALRG